MILFNHSPLPKWIYDIETLQFLLVNHAACEAYGFTKEEFLSMTIKDIRPQEDIQMMEKLLQEAIKNGEQNHSKALRHTKKNGEIILVKIKSNAIQFNEKQVRLVTAVDVTSEIIVQNEIQETNSKLKLASEIAHLGYWTNDLVKSEIQWSDEVYKIFELDPKNFKLTLDNIKNCFQQEEHDNFNSDINPIINNTETIETERKINTGAGNIKWVLERINLITDEDGKPIRLVGIVLDITKRKLNEQEIIESNERFKILTKATIEAIIDWDIKNDTVIWGEGFQTIFGYDLSTYDNYLWSNNIHPDDREKVLEDLNKILLDPTKEFFNAEFRYIKANKEITFVQHKGVFIRDKNGIAIRALAAMIDLTETQERLHKIELQNKILKDIAWTQSHIVRAPLAKLMGLVTHLKDDIDSGTTDKTIIDYITTSANELDEIIKNIVKNSNQIDNI